MKIKYYFCTTELGVLEKTDDNKYVYNSNIPNEQKLSNNSEFKISGYSLAGSTNKESAYLFGEFQQLIHDYSKYDLIRKSAKIKVKDSAWEKLVKYSKLKYFTPGLYTQLADTDIETKETE